MNAQNIRLTLHMEATEYTKEGEGRCGEIPDGSESTCISQMFSRATVQSIIAHTAEHETE